MWSLAIGGDVGDQLVGAFQNPGLLLGIPLALAGAVFMSFGAQYQHRGVTKVERLSGQEAAKGLTGGQLYRLLSRPSWVVGTVMLILAIVCQLGALSVAPLIVVQPLGAVSLVITTLLNARISGHAPTRRSAIAIVACVGGIFVFVLIAAIFATERDVTQGDLIIILALLGVLIVVFAAMWIWLRKKMGALFYIMAAGVVYGFVATLAKVVVPTRLKAEVRVAETQARDVALGQPATIDTRNGVVPGHVVRVDPAVQNGTVLVEIKLDGPLPRGARPDLSVEGTIELERLDEALHVGRPVQGQSDSTVGLFRIQPDGTHAVRVPVKLGRSSVSTIEIVEGLQVGDQIILSDMSQYDGVNRVRIGTD